MEGSDVQNAEKWVPKMETHKGREKRKFPRDEKGGEAAEGADREKRNRPSRYRNDEMRRHMQAIRDRARDRHVAAGVTARNAFGRERVTGFFGISSLAKQSEVIFNKGRVPSDLHKAVHKDTNAVLAASSREANREWTHAPRGEPYGDQAALVDLAHGTNIKAPYRKTFSNRGHHLPDADDDLHDLNTSDVGGGRELARGVATKGRATRPVVDNVTGTFFTPQETTFITKSLRDKVSAGKAGQVLFPSDPPLHEIASRILASVPPITLRNDDPMTYSQAACHLIAAALNSSPSHADGDPEQQPSSFRSSTRHDRSARPEGILHSFYEKTEPFVMSSPGSDTSTEAHDFEQIVVNTAATSETTPSNGSVVHSDSSPLRTPECFSEKGEVDDHFLSMFGLKKSSQSESGCSAIRASEAYSRASSERTLSNFTFSKEWNDERVMRFVNDEECDFAISGHPIRGLHERRLGLSAVSNGDSYLWPSLASVNATFASSDVTVTSPATAVNRANSFEFFCDGDISSCSQPQSSPSCSKQFFFEF